MITDDDVKDIVQSKHIDHQHLRVIRLCKYSNIQGIIKLENKDAIKLVIKGANI